MPKFCFGFSSDEENNGELGLSLKTLICKRSLNSQTKRLKKSSNDAN